MYLQHCSGDWADSAVIEMMYNDNIIVIIIVIIFYVYCSLYLLKVNSKLSDPRCIWCNFAILYGLFNDVTCFVIFNQKTELKRYVCIDFSGV